MKKIKNKKSLLPSFFALFTFTFLPSLHAIVCVCGGGCATTGLAQVT